MIPEPLNMSDVQEAVAQQQQVESPLACASPQQEKRSASGFKGAISKIFSNSWSSDSTSSPEGNSLIAAFRAMMPKGSQSGSGSGLSRFNSSIDASRSSSAYMAPPPISPGRRSTLLAICQQLPPSMQRAEWCLDDYIITDKLYKGYASMVYKAICKRSREVVVLKCYLMSSICELYQHQIYREVRLHNTCAHENIIKLFAAFQEGERVVMVQEFADGGDLFNLLQKYGGCLSERVAVQMVLDPFLRVLQYLHTRAIIHRDIKPENILFADCASCLKLADFGLAIDLRQERAVTRAGTLDYMAPEVLKCPYKSKPEENKEKEHLHYNNTVDSWAVGVLVYELLVGCPPFYDKSKSNTEARIVSGVPHFPPTISEAAKNFICAALRKNPAERPTVLEMVHHPWVELFRMRRSMRQINLLSAAPDAASSSFTAGQVAAASAAAGAAITPSGHSLSHLAPASAAARLQQPGPGGSSSGGGSSSRDSSSQDEGHGHASAASAAAAALSEVKKTFKQSVASKVHALQGHSGTKADAKLGSKGDLHAQLTSASSPCLMHSGMPGMPTARAPAGLRRPAAPPAAAGSIGAPAAAAPASPPAMAAPCVAAPAALSPPGALHKGGSLRLDADAKTFLFAAVFTGKAAGQLAPGGQGAAAVSAAAAPHLHPKQQQQQASIKAPR